jgi:hypothetical protein
MRIHQEIRQLENLASFIPEAVKNFGISLWGRMSDHTQRPQHMMNLAREGLFADHNAVVPNRIIQERKLPHQVQGILSRVTVENYGEMRNEFFDLPVRQSTREEIAEVVRVFFKTAIEPQQTPYAELYVRLIVDLMEKNGPKAESSKLIRHEIISQCQKFFEEMISGLDPQKVEEALGLNGLDDEEKSIRIKMMKDKLKANISLLGLLYINGLVHEKILYMVLFDLLYSRDRTVRRRTPQDYELEIFVELLKKVGKFLPGSIKEKLPGFRKTLDELSRNHPVNRIRFLLLDVVELIDNDFAEKRMREGAPRGSSDHHPGGRLNHATQPPTQILRKEPPQKGLPRFEEFREAMTNYLESDQHAQAINILKQIPDSKTKVEYCAMWIGRIMTVVRSNHRQQLGEMFSGLVQAKAITCSEAKAALLTHLQRWVTEDGPETHPKYFVGWAEMMVKGEIFTADLHTKFMELLVEAHAPVSHIQKMIADVSATSGSHLMLYPQQDQVHLRFRLLPALLRYCPVLTVDMECYAGDDESDILEGIADPEVSFYWALFLEEEPNRLLTRVSRADNRGEAGYIIKIVCAIFSYVRFDVAAICQSRGIKEVLTKMLSVGSRGQFDLAVLHEVHQTWSEFGRVPVGSFFSFVKWLLDNGIVGARSIASFKAQLVGFYGKGGMEDSQLLEGLRYVAS